MPDGEINNGQLRTAFAEITAVKLIMSAILTGVLPPDAKEANTEIDAMIKHVKRLAFRAVAEGVDRETSDKVMKVGEEQAVRFFQQHIKAARKR